MMGLATWGLEEYTPRGRTLTPEQLRKRRDRAKTQKARRAVLRDARLETADSLVMRYASGAVRRAYLRADEPSDLGIAYWWVFGLTLRFPRSKPFPGTVHAMVNALGLVTDGAVSRDAAERIHELASGMW